MGLGDKTLAKLWRRIGNRLKFVFAQRMPERRQARLSLGQAHARLKPSNDIQPARTPVIEIVPSRSNLRLHHHGSKNIRGGAQHETFEARRCNAYDGKRMAVYEDAVIHHPRV